MGANSVSKLALAILVPAWALPIVYAADAPQTEPAAALPATAPATAPAPNVDVRLFGSATTRPSRKVSLNFKDAPLDVVLDQLAEAAGLMIIKEGQVQGRVTVQTTEALTPEEAVTLLNAVLRANGFGAVQNGRIVRIASRDKVKKAGVPVHVGADPAQIEANFDLITQVIPIKNVDAGKLKTDLAPLIGPDADVTSNEASNSIVITDASVNIRRIVEIIVAMDQGQSFSTELRLIHLKFADSATTAKLITAVFHSGGGGGNAQQQQQIQMMMQQQGMAAPANMGGGHTGKVPGSAIDQALHGGQVHADSDDRTNTLIVTAPAPALKIIEDIIKELDSNPVPASQLKAFRLSYADAEATSKLLTALVNKSDNGPQFPFFFGFGPTPEQSHAHVNITFDARTNAVIVSAPAEMLKPIEDLIKNLDESPGPTPVIRTFHLLHADAYFTSKMISTMFDTENKDQGGGGGFFRALFGGQSSSGAKTSKLTATSDDRTNTLIITGPLEAMKAVEELVTKLDADTSSEESLFIYRLRNAQAANLELVLNTLFGNTQNQGNNQQNQNQNAQAIQQQQPQPGGGAFGGRGGAGNQAGGGTGIGARRGQNGAQGAGQRNANGRLPGRLQQAVSEMAGEVSVVADVDTNSLIVTTASKYRDAVRQIIKELDRPAPQVLIKVLIAEVSHDDSADWGVDFSVLNTRASGKGQIGVQQLGNAAAGTANGGLIVTLLETNVNATLHALATEGKLDVLSRPYILASDNQLATITVGQEVPFITNTQLTEAGQQINTIQYQDVGIILNVTPHINEEGLVILDVAPEISQISSQTVPISAGVAAPVIDKRSAQSRVGIRNGQTIVIGGLMQDQKTVTISKVPLLGDIPWLGELFRRTQISKNKTELLIFLTPHVALQPDVLDGMSKEEIHGTRLTPNAVIPGTFDDHMTGMKRGSPPQSRPSDPPATEPVKYIRGAGSATQP